MLIFRFSTIFKHDLQSLTFCALLAAFSKTKKVKTAIYKQENREYLVETKGQAPVLNRTMLQDSFSGSFSLSSIVEYDLFLKRGKSQVMKAKGWEDNRKNRTFVQTTGRKST